MQRDIPEDIQSLIDLVAQNGSNDGAMRAVLVLLEQAPDSSVIVDGLGQIEPGLVSNAELRARAATLLRKADALELAEGWHKVPAPKLSDNVIPMDRSSVPVSDPSVSITFDDIGGLENVKKQVRRKIINPFQNKKALFDRFKRKAGGGVLMYGPPGCGKTMLARALAFECKATFQNVRAADVLDQYVGNAEKRIAQIFQEARASRPVVLFFDEIEALAQKRQFESSARVNTTVSALLTEMDGFSDNEGVLFLGATNVPWSIDSAFRRPGRFDRTLFVPPPDRVARKFILDGLLKDRPVSESLDIERIIESCTGFSGADLSALVDTAVDIAIEESPSVEALVPLSTAHFQEASQEVKSSVGEWLGQARNFAEYANSSGMYDDLSVFLKKYAR
ncbi:ATP-binding protein [uncultured Roseibium sp.]|uniref:ATP-binding protein n=1 Tax=uncultured Roseibium sp. TaxID=1936171 RepID=UPI0026286594|nr:ATP-binding protein [uncultured Roseibium sp.]